MSEENVFEVKELEELVAIVPYLKTVNTVVQFVKRKRVERFFISLANLTREFTENEKKRLNDYVASEVGAEILTDFIDTSQRTSSKIANTTLAIVYAKSATGAYSENFASKVGRSIEGLDDRLSSILIHFFDPEALAYGKLPDENFYKLYALYPAHLKGGGSVLVRNDGVLSDGEDLVNIINEFITRGILMPDHSSGRFSDEEVKTPVFGVGSYTEQLRLLMAEADTLLHM